MLVKRLLAGLILLLLSASTTWGVGCDLRCSLGQFSSSEQRSAAGSAVPSARSNQMEMADASMPAEHCHHMSQLTQTARMPHIEVSSPAGPSNCAHATAALCSHQSCEYASALVSQLRKLHIQETALEIFSVRLPLNVGDRVQAAMEKAEVRSTSPPVLPLRL